MIRQQLLIKLSRFKICNICPSSSFKAVICTAALAALSLTIIVSSTRTTVHLVEADEIELSSAKNDNFLQKISIIKHGDYCVIENVLKTDYVSREGESSLQNVTLCTQASIDYLPYLLTQARRWGGPISAALFMPSFSVVVEAMRGVGAFRDCHPELGAVTASLFFPSTNGSCEVGAVIVVQTDACWADCGRLETCAAGLNLSDSFDFDEYPRNVGRNLAKAGAVTPLVLVVDIELIPNEGFVSAFTEFFARWRNQISRRRFDWLSRADESYKKEVFVVPAFEVAESVPHPGTRTELAGLLSSSSAVLFHAAFCWSCHRFPSQALWMDRLSSRHARRANVLTSVRWHKGWEPVYVGWNTAPDWDERFKGAGYNKIQQNFKLCVLGYMFRVMEGLFVTHSGIKVSVPHNFTDKDMMRNMMLYQQFQEETKAEFAKGHRCY